MADPGIGIQILYEDNHMLAAVKPAGVLSQSDGSGVPDMLTQLKAWLKQRYEKPSNVFLGLVHRLDRPVGGVMVFGKTSKGASRLSAQIRERSFHKEYLAVVAGRPEAVAGTLRDRLYKDPLTGNAARSQLDEPGKEAVLQYRQLAFLPVEGMGLLHIRLETGRSHQIRIQLSSAGCPVWGDRRYGSKGQHTTDSDAGIALFACRLKFAHPVSRAEVTIEALPPDHDPWSRFKEVLAEGIPDFSQEALS